MRVWHKIVAQLGYKVQISFTQTLILLKNLPLIVNKYQYYYYKFSLICD